MKESFNEVGERVVQPDDYIEAVLRESTKELEAGTTMTEDDLQYYGKQIKQEERSKNLSQPTVERTLKELTVTSEFSPEERARMRAEVFNSMNTFFYQNNRIKSVDVLCRQLREVLTEAGMSETDIHALFRGELAAVTKQLATYEEVKTPRAEQAQEEMALRARLLSTATARFFETTKKTIAEVVASSVPEQRASVLAPVAPVPTSEVNVAKMHVAMADEVVPTDLYKEDHALFLRSNRARKLETKQRRREDRALPQSEKLGSSGDNGSEVAATARTIDVKAMSSESPKIVPPTPEELERQRAELDNFVEANALRRKEAAAAVDAVVSERTVSQTTEKKTGWWDKGFRDAKNGEVVATNVEKTVSSESEEEAERSVASLMAQADRLIALTRSRREQADVSHKEAKNLSADYTAARSEITKIKNRLRAILDDRDVANKRAEIGELRKSLAEHLWNLRKDFPLQKEAAGESPLDTNESVPTDPLAEKKAAAVEVLREKFAKANEAKAAALRAGVPVLITLPDGRKVEGETELIHDNGTTLAVSWLEDGTRKQQVVDRTAVMQLTETEVLPEDGTPLERFSSDTTLHEAARVALNEQNPEVAPSQSERQFTRGESVLVTRPDGSRAAATVDAVSADGKLVVKLQENGKDVYLNNINPREVSPMAISTPVDFDESLLPLPDYMVAATEAGADTSALLSVESAVAAAREKLEATIAARGIYPNAILAESQSDQFMTLKKHLQTLEERLASAKLSAAVMRPEEVQALRSELADVEYRLSLIPAQKEKQEPYMLTEDMLVRDEVLKEGAWGMLARMEERARGRLREQLPAVADRELDPKKESKARRWFERGGILTVGFLLGMLAGADQEQKNGTGPSVDPFETSAPASPSDTIEPSITIVPDVKPIEGAWPTAEADAGGEALSETAEPAAAEAGGTIEPTITDVTDRVAAETEKAPDYTVKASDNLWDFAEGDVEDREQLAPLNGLTELQKNLVLNDMVTALKYNKDLMRELGLRSGNPNKIFPGEVIKTQVLVDLLEEIKRDRGLS